MPTTRYISVSSFNVQYKTLDTQFLFLLYFGVERVRDSAVTHDDEHVLAFNTK